MRAVILSFYGWWCNLVFQIIGSMRTEVCGRKQGAEEIFRTKKAKVAKAWRKLYDLHGLCISTNIIWMVE
jgi:hypothetical protein